MTPAAVRWIAPVPGGGGLKPSLTETGPMKPALFIPPVRKPIASPLELVRAMGLPWNPKAVRGILADQHRTLESPGKGNRWRRRHMAHLESGLEPYTRTP